jgi:hypothetical protein
MTQQTLLSFVLIAAVFLAGASVGQLLLRIRLARLERINMRLDQRRLNALARAWQSRAANRAAGTGDETLFELEVRNEIDSILTEIEHP